MLVQYHVISAVTVRYVIPNLVEIVSRGSVEARNRLLALVRERPKLVVPYAKEIAKLLDSTSGPVRSASLEALAALSRVSPATMAFLLPKLHTLLSNEPQNTLANNAVEILSNYAKTSTQAAAKVIPILKKSLDGLGPKAAEQVKKIIDGIDE